MLQTDFDIFPQINTSRLLLRKITLADAPGILALRSSPDVMRYMDKERAVTIRDAEIFITQALDTLKNNDGITWAIALAESPDLLIGTIGYWKIIKEHYRAEIGYMLHPIHWNQGIMKEALVPVLNAGFNELKLHSIEAHINPENRVSAALLLGNGFIKEAHFRENYFFEGKFKDTAVYSRLQ